MPHSNDDLASFLIGSGAPIACFVTGRPSADVAAPMPRVPGFPTGQEFGRGFRDLFEEATSANPAIHDGAVVLTREVGGERYHVAEWSCRLFPPQFDVVQRPNMGSAYNSCLHMSLVAGVDLVVKPSDVAAFLFVRGRVRRIEAAVAIESGFGRA